MKKSVSIIGLILLLASIVLCFVMKAEFDYKSKIDRYLEKTGKSLFTFLCVGVDDIASNTDSILLISLDVSDKSVCVMQLPRDTFFEHGGSTDKINNVYSSFLQEEKTRQESFALLKEQISNTFSIPIDFYISYNSASVANIIDEIGGIELDIPFDMYYIDKEQGLCIDIKKGKQHLSGEQAVLYARYRDEYLEGDVGRLDAQKKLFSAVFEKAKSVLTIEKGLSVVNKYASLFETDITFDCAIMLAAFFASDELEHSDVLYLTAPGESSKDEISGTWYYIINKESCVDVIKQHFSHSFDIRTFDENEILFDHNNIKFENIYNAPKYEYQLYSGENVKEIDVKTK